MHGLEEERMHELEQELTIEDDNDDIEEIDLENGNLLKTGVFHCFLFNIDFFLTMCS